MPVAAAGRFRSQELKAKVQKECKRLNVNASDFDTGPQHHVCLDLRWLMRRRQVDRLRC